jgi:topoisomerase-4 subunit B
MCLFTDVLNRPMATAYTEKSIRTLESHEHIRLRPGMYVGKLGDGTSPDDGIYVLLKEVVDNSIDEHAMGFGKRIEISLTKQSATVRDFGRGIPLGKVVDAVSRMNTGAKYDSETFQKSVGLNGVGAKAVNALSASFTAEAFRDGKTKQAEFSQGQLVNERRQATTKERNGTRISFSPDEALFDAFQYRREFVEEMLWNYAFLNTGLTLVINGKSIRSEKGLLDYLEHNQTGDLLYPTIQLMGDDIEVAFSHGTHYGEDIASFVNGQYTTQGGTHLAAFREGIVKTVRDFFKKDYDAADIRASIVAAVSIRVQEPVFESQTKVKLGSTDMGPKGPSVRNFVVSFLRKELDNYLHRNPSTTQTIQKKIQASERERRELTDIRDIARDRAKKANLHNRKLRDCRIHLGTRDRKAEASSIFIVEGDSAAGSLTACRDVATQAVFALKGKPLNTYGLSKRVCYENEEFNLLQAALNIEDGLDGLRYNKVIIATDADVDGMHIRLLLLSFFIQFFPDLIRNGHLSILQTPLFRVRNKKKTHYCYNETERDRVLEEIGKNPEVTRFKGLGEISAGEFKDFIGKNIRVDPVTLAQVHDTDKLLSFYMGKNTPLRQEFIIENLVVEKDLVNA